jgi:hypothetical protein
MRLRIGDGPDAVPRPSGQENGLCADRFASLPKRPLASAADPATALACSIPQPLPRPPGLLRRALNPPLVRLVRSASEVRIIIRTRTDTYPLFENRYCPTAHKVL